MRAAASGGGLPLRGSTTTEWGQDRLCNGPAPSNSQILRFLKHHPYFKEQKIKA